MWNRTKDQVTLVFIRHGETAANRAHRYLGKTDESLSKEGIQALVSYKQQKCYPAVEYLFSSPMKRCLETAQILYPNLCPVVIPEWTEMDFGEFEYKDYEELNGDARYQAWIDSGGTLAFPGGESREAFLLRCECGFTRMYGKLYREIEQSQSAGKTIRAGIIVHGGTIMALLSSHDCLQSNGYGGLYNNSLRRKEYFDYQVANGKGYVCCMEMATNPIEMEYPQERYGRSDYGQMQIREIRKL